MLKFLELREKLKTSEFNALCLYGNDAWLKRKSVANVCEAYGIVDDGFSVDKLVAPTVEDIRLACFTPSMFSAKKLVVCEDFLWPEGNAKVAEIKRHLSETVAQCDGSFCLLFVSDSDKNFTDISGMETVNCNRLDKASIVKWITSYCKRNGVTVDALCADRIATYCLLDMSRVEVETQKLIDYGDISVESIDMLVHKDTEYAVYDLSGAIADKNANRATEIYRGLIARGEEARALFALIYNFYRRVYYVKTSTFTNEEMANYLGVKAGAISFAKDTANRYKPMQLKRALDYLSLADERIKAFVDENEVMQILIMQLISL
ncbi:MAG: DNA polymerase III subunit delta [Clostridiales bacterium]|nr:DNA polymerase III subunit delta [Clostridiales bacterium]